MIEDFLLKSPTLAMIGKHEYPTDKLQQCTKSSLQVAMQIFPKHNPEKIQHLLQSVSLFCLNLILVSYSFIFLSTCRQQKINYSNTTDATSKTRSDHLHASVIFTAFHFLVVVLSLKVKIIKGFSRHLLCRPISIILQAGTRVRGLLVRLKLIFVPCSHFGIPQTVWLSQWSIPAINSSSQSPWRPQASCSSQECLTEIQT